MSSEKTEQPTSQRIRKAREDGQVAKSKDFTEVVLMGALVGYLLASGPDTFKRFAEMIAMPGQLSGMDFHDAVSLATVAMVRVALEILAPYLLIVIILAVLVEAAQTGMLVSFKALVPKGDKLDPVSNLKQWFSKKSLVEFGKNCLKVVILCAIVTYVVRETLEPLVKIPLAGMGASGAVLAEAMWKLFVHTFGVFFAIGLADVVWQRHSYVKGLMMSMEEIKQEHKQMEGDPHMKHHRKEFARELVLGDEEPAHATRKASVVVTNPTHLAIALFYEEELTPLPIVLAKGEGVVAEAMKRAAEECEIPVIQDVPLARGLMREATVRQYIPGEFVEPVAQVLLALRRLKQEKEMQEDNDDF